MKRRIVEWVKLPRGLCAMGLVLGVFVVSDARAQAAPPASAPAAAPSKAPTAAKPAKKPAAQPVKLVVEPRAMELLKAMGDRLAAAKSMSFTATVGYEYPSRYGPPIVYTSRYDVTMQRPDKLKIVMPGDGPASEFYYDGKVMMAYAPVANLVAVADAPPTIDDALKAAYVKAAIYYPFMDLLMADPYAALTDGVKLAFYIGPSGVVGGVKTDMMVWANEDVFLQIWIGTDDKLPRRVRAVYRTDPLQLRHEMELSNWKLDPVVAPEAFVSQKAQAAQRMEFKHPAKGTPSGAKPLEKLVPSKPAPAKPATKTQ